jgi:hypothetical protein
MAGLPQNQAKVQERIAELEARLKTRGQRPEPEIPNVMSIPSPAACTATVGRSVWCISRRMHAASCSLTP